MKRRKLGIGLALLVVAIGAAVFVLRGQGRSPEIPALPDLVGLEENVARRLRDRHDRLADSPSYENWLTYGRSLQVHGKTTEALSAYEAAATIGEDPFEALYLSAWLVSATDVEKALDLADRAMARRDRYAPLHLLRGQCLLDLDRNDEAEKAYERARSLQESSHALLGLAQVAMRRSRIDEAIPLLEKARELAPEHREVLLLLAQAYTRKGRQSDSEAVAAAARAITVKTRVSCPILARIGDEGVSYRALEEQSIAMTRQGRFADALAAIDRAIDARPDYAPGRHAKAKILFQMGRYADVDALLTVLNASGPTADTLCLQGMALVELKKPDAAKVCLEAALAREPSHAQSNLVLAGVRLSEGRFDLAADRARSLLAREPERVDALYILASALAGLGRREEAVREMEHALQLDPKNALLKEALDEIRGPGR